MAELLRNLLLLILTPECYDEYFVNFNFVHVPCLKATLSKGIGLSIIAGSMLVKVPQILKIVDSRSAEGISIYGVFLELFAISANVSYSYIMQFPISAWGEGLFLVLQTAAIAALVLHYNGSTQKAAAFLVAYSTTLFVLTSGLTHVSVLWCLQAANVPVVVAGKMIQAMSNYQNGGTGQLSAVTVFMLLFGSMARIFTSIQETGDTVLILTYVFATAANGIIAAQLLYYWNVDKKKKAA